MSLHVQVLPRVFHFIHPVTTSRGTYRTRKSWFIYFADDDEPDKFGIGECAPLPDLSCDYSGDDDEYGKILLKFCKDLEKTGVIDYEALRSYPSIVFGMETALKHYEHPEFNFWDTPFSQGEEGLPINGLVWMGDYNQMMQRMENKLIKGFRCLKFKIGGLDFEKELSILKLLRKYWSPRKLEIRLDANGAFTPEEALEKLDILAELDIHSMEQPIKAGQYKEMAHIIRKSPIAIALDEELIGHNTIEEKSELIDKLRPQYLVLKPSLHGGYKGCEEWIKEGKELDVEYWVTSALESNIGLNAIAQWCANLHTTMPQGLGTGQLFRDNIDVPIEIRADKLWFKK